MRKAKLHKHPKFAARHAQVTYPVSPRVPSVPVPDPDRKPVLRGGPGAPNTNLNRAHGGTGIYVNLRAANAYDLARPTTTVPSRMADIQREGKSGKVTR